MTKNTYEKPELEKVEFSSVDVITASVDDDPDQGAWDPLGV